MDRILKQLIQLQELHLTLLEQRTLVPKGQLHDLEKAVTALLDGLPSSIANLYQGLQRRDNVAVVPEVKGTCSACGIALPTSMAAELIAKRGIQQCPNCLRILYHDEGRVQRIKRPLHQTGAPRVGVAKFSSVELMQPKLSADSAEEAIGELVDLMAGHGFVEDPKGLLAAALCREALCSTAVEHGLAFPHVRGIEGGGLIFSLGLKKRGFKFAPQAEKLTKIVFFLIIPSASSVFYLRLISGLIEALRTEGARKKLLAAATPEEMWTILKGLTKKTIP